MLAVTVICVGKLKEKWLIEAEKEYEKRLNAFARLKIIELPEERLPDSPHPGEIAAALEKEGTRILETIPRGSHVAAMCIEGKEMSSERFAAKMSDLQTGGVSHLCFVIGGSFGLSEEIKRSASWRLSLSPMTFPHHLARILLLEQLYRGFSILKGGKYHK